MSTHETIVRDENIEPGSDRSFGLIVGGILTAIGGYRYFAGLELYLWLMAPGLVLVSLGLFIPKMLHPLNLLWMKLGLLLGRIVTPIVMFAVYVVAIVPIGAILRLSGKDLLKLKTQEGSSTYWIERTPPGPPPESLKDQF